MVRAVKFVHERGILCAELWCGVKFVHGRGVLCAEWPAGIGWDRPGASQSVPVRPGASRSSPERPGGDTKKGPQARSPESILHFHQEKCISWNGAAGGAAVFLGQHLGDPFGLFFAKTYFKE